MAVNEKVLCLFEPKERIGCFSLRQFMKVVLILQTILGLWSVFLFINSIFNGYLEAQLKDGWTFSSVMFAIYFTILLIQFGATFAGWKAILVGSIPDSNAYYTWNRDLWMSKYALMVGFYLVVKEYLLMPYPIELKPFGPDVMLIYFLLATIIGLVIEGVIVFGIASFNYFLTKGEIRVIDPSSYTIIDNKVQTREYIYTPDTCSRLLLDSSSVRRVGDFLCIGNRYD